MINQTLFLKINSLAGHSIWLDRLAIFFAVYSGFILLVVLAYLWFAKSASRRIVIVALITAGIARFGITSIIRFFYYHPRPFAILHVNQLIPESGSSFPSGHASFFFALSTMVYFYNHKLGWAFFVLSALMGVARVYAGVHWPLDILSGVVTGIVTAILINWVYRRLYGNEVLKPSHRIKNPT